MMLNERAVPNGTALLLNKEAIRYAGDPDYQFPIPAKCLFKAHRSIEFIAGNMIYYIIDEVVLGSKPKEEIICDIFQ